MAQLDKKRQSEVNKEREKIDQTLLKLKSQKVEFLGALQYSNGRVIIESPKGEAKKIKISVEEIKKYLDGIQTKK